MTETNTTSTTQPVPDHVAVEALIEVLSQALDEAGAAAVDIGHMTGDDEPEVNLSLTSNWGSRDNLLFILWHETDDNGAVELGTFKVDIRRVI